MIKISWSHIGILITFIVVGFIIFSNKYWRDEKKIIEHDIISYYGYLPSCFIYQDLSLHYLDKKSVEVRNKVWYMTADNGGRLIKTTMGVSLFYLPFFVLAHQYALSSSHLANGFTLPYRLAIAMCSFFFFILGLFYLRKFLLHFFDDFTVFWTLLIVGIGTNIVNYVTKEPGMSHVYSFFLIAVFLNLCYEWHKHQRFKTIGWLGIVVALITLVRPVNVLVILFFIFYNVNSIKSLKQKMLLFYSERFNILKAMALGFLVFVPQLLYWKYNSGQWLFYSYSDNEGFFFKDPKIIEGLFSYRKGWLVYTPLMIFSIIGLFISKKSTIKLRWGIGIFFLLFIYITFSWWSWWYGGSFGMRPLIDVYPILAISLAAFIAAILKYNWSKILFSFVFVAFIALNLLQNYQYVNGFLHHDSMTKASYWLVWGKTEHPKLYWESLSQPDYEAAKNGER